MITDGHIYKNEGILIGYDDDGCIDFIGAETWTISSTEDGPLRVSFYGGRTIDRVIEVLELAQWIEDGMA